MAKKKAVGRGGAREGAGRPIGDDGPTMTLTVTVPETLVAELDRVAEAKGWKRSKVATEAIRAYVGRKR
jgi:hypothetical protein